MTGLEECDSQSNWPGRARCRAAPAIQIAAIGDARFATRWRRSALSMQPFNAMVSSADRLPLHLELAHLQGFV
jgi:hypothetical protein